MMYQRFRSRLAVVELSDRSLSGVDRDLVRVAEARLIPRGGRVLTGARATGWEERDGGAWAPRGAAPRCNSRCDELRG